MFLDLQNDGKPVSEYPTQVSEDIRQRYSLKLSISEFEIENKLSGEMETKQVLVVEDNGIGMDTEIIEKYFLQVGRSFYISDEFRQKFSFTATSRFGIGFLSVFAASDKVTVETYKPSSEIPENKPLKITLTGFRNYLLHEKSDKKTSGTRIEIFLRESFEKGKLKETVSDWCKRVEFPIEVDDFGEKSTITAERPEDFIFEMPLITNPKEKFVIRSFPINENGIEGEFYIHAHIDEDGIEEWHKYIYFESWYEKSHPLASRPQTVNNSICFHGIQMSASSHHLFDLFSFRIDLRNISFQPNLNREKVGNNDSYYQKLIRPKFREILAKHLEHHKLSGGKELRNYRYTLANLNWDFEFWKNYPDFLEIEKDKEIISISINELYNSENFYVELKLKDSKILSNQKKVRFNQDQISLPDNSLVLKLEHKNKNIFGQLIASEYFPCEAKIDCDNKLFIKLAKSDEKSSFDKPNILNNCIFTKVSNDKSLTFVSQELYRDCIFFNIENDFSRWLNRMLVLASQDNQMVLMKYLNDLWENCLNRQMSFENVNSIMNYVSKWKEIPDLPKEFHPPKFKSKNYYKLEFE